MTQTLKQALRELGQSVTTPRLLVFEQLHQAAAPMKVSDLARALEGQLDRASVYRSVALFRRLGFIRDVSAGWHQLIELGDRFDPHHHHLTCEGCGSSVTFEDAGLEVKLEKLARLHGYALASHQLELTGRCAQCQKA